jgi:hypothetical protein
MQAACLLLASFGYVFGLHSESEDGSSKFLRKMCTSSRVHGVIPQKIVLFTLFAVEGDENIITRNKYALEWKYSGRKWLWLVSVRRGLLYMYSLFYLNQVRLQRFGFARRWTPPLLFRAIFIHTVFSKFAYAPVSNPNIF